MRFRFLLRGVDTEMVAQWSEEIKPDQGPNEESSDDMGLRTETALYNSD